MREKECEAGCNGNAIPYDRTKIRQLAEVYRNVRDVLPNPYEIEDCDPNSIPLRCERPYLLT